jgi:hypothetical protein
MLVKKAAPTLAGIVAIENEVVVMVSSSTIFEENTAKASN